MMTRSLSCSRRNTSPTKKYLFAAFHHIIITLQNPSEININQSPSNSIRNTIPVNIKILLHVLLTTADWHWPMFIFNLNPVLSSSIISTVLIAISVTATKWQRKPSCRHHTNAWHGYHDNNQWPPTWIIWAYSSLLPFHWVDYWPQPSDKSPEARGLGLQYTLPVSFLSCLSPPTEESSTVLAIHSTNTGAPMISQANTFCKLQPVW